MTDQTFCQLAKETAALSKNDKIKVGAVLVQHGNVIGRSANDLNWHAEENVLCINADGCTLYVYPVAPCPRCAAVIIRSGVRRVVTFLSPDNAPTMRPDQLDLTRELFKLAGVEHHVIRE